VRILYALPLLAVPSILSADIVTLKDGAVIECRIVNSGIVRDNRQFIEVENEKKEKREIAVDQIVSLYKGETSWEARERNLKWYGEQKEKVKETWAGHASFARQCKQRKLDDRHLEHARKAYALRRAEAKDDMEAHDRMARWLEKELFLFDEAQAQYRLVYEFKKARAKDKDSERYNLGKWCESKALYDDAEAEFAEAVNLNPKNAMARQGLERLKLLRESLFNPATFRTVKDQLLKAAAYYKPKANSDGSYGGDIAEAGVQGHRGQASICGLGLIAAWEAEAADRPDALKTPPAEVDKCLTFVLGSPEERKALRGPDVWGNCWAIAFLAACLRKPALKDRHPQIKAKIEACYGGLTRQMGPDGGWSYYDFAKSTSMAFLTAAVIVHLHDAKRAGVPIPDQLHQRAVACLKAQDQGNGVWMYRTTVKQTVEGSQGRAPLCETAMLLSGQGSQAKVQVAVDNFFKHRGILAQLKGKSGTHDMSKGGTAPYYYLYGHYWAARAIKQLDRGVQNGYLSKLRDIVVQDQESDGCLWDFPMARTCKVYGSALGALIFYQIGTLEPLDPKLNQGR
jgi:hypothetical protein